MLYVKENITKDIRRGVAIMLISIDESGSINNHNDTQQFFVITLIRVKGKGTLKGKHAKFVNKFKNRLKELDVDNKMFNGDDFLELKGHYFDSEMRRNFLEFFKNSSSFEIYYIKYYNAYLSDTFCKNTERAFNYPLKLALHYYLKNGVLPSEDIKLNLDNRNLKTDSKMELGEYLNTELTGSLDYDGHVDVTYFDSVNNRCIQIADVFSNIFYQNLSTHEFDQEFKEMQMDGHIKGIFEYPLTRN